MKHRIRVCGLLRMNDHLVLIQQVNPVSGHRHWTLPGGGMEATDENIYRAVEREVFEETGLRARAGAVRYISEHFAQSDQCTMITLWIDCQPAEDRYGALTLANTMHDDNIADVRWWTRESLMTMQEHNGIGRLLLQEAFWENLDAPTGMVTYLGRTTG